MENLDATIDNMENSRFAALYGSLIKELAATSEMSQTDITCLLVVYYKFSKANGPQCKKMTKKQFYQIFLVLFNVANVQVIERTLLAITKDTKYVSPQAWIHLFDLYTTKDIHVRMKFAFEVSIWDLTHTCIFFILVTPRVTLYAVFVGEYVTGR